MAVAVYGDSTARSFANTCSGRSGELWPGLEPHRDDLTLRKRGASALFPGACGLQAQLVRRSIENVLIAGTVTNVCCEATARDAVALGYRTTMISDCCAGHAFGLHEASLATFYRAFGDVRPAYYVMGLLGPLS